MFRSAPFALALILPLALASCGGDEPTRSEGQDRPLVIASFEPLRWIAAGLAGDLAEIAVLVPADADPLHWKPDAAATQRIQSADLLLLNGAGAEGWTDKINVPLSKTVDASNGFAREFIEIEGAVTHRHGPGEEHTHAGLDPHVWLDPQNLRQQARAVHAAMKRSWPQHEQVLDQNLAALEREIDTLHAGLESLGKQPKDAVFVASHPAYNYVARRYGWEMHNLDLDPESMPDEATFTAIRQALATKQARWIFWESEPTPEIAARFRQDLGLESVLFSPGELLGSEERAAGQDFASVMRANIERLRPVFAAR